MNLIVFGRRPKPAVRSHLLEPVWHEADRLEEKLGRAEAIVEVRARIARADRLHRRRLYELHDELARRTGPDRKVG